MMRSLRARLLAGMVAGMVGLLILFGVVVYAAVHRSLVDGFNASLAVTAKAVAGQIEQKGQKLKFEYDDLKMPEFERKDNPEYFEIWQDDGKVLARSPSLGTADLPRLSGSVAAPGFQALTLPNGRPGRAAGLESTPRMEDQDEDAGESRGDRASGLPAKAQRVLVVTARESGELESQLLRLRWILLGGSGGAILLSLLVAAAVVRRGLRPMNSLAAQIADIRADHLQARVARQGMPAEMTGVVRRLNDLLERLQAAFERERSFTADVAHELRTPLAGLRSTLEVAMSRDRSAGEYQEALGDCLAVGKRMQSMVDNLLMLARLDAGQVKLNPQPVRLAELVDSCWRYFSDKASARRIVFENALPPNLTCTADREMLSLVVSNVLANAAEYANDGGRIRVSPSGSDRPELTFSNTGWRIGQEEVAHVFDRFWRADPSRGGQGVHCGLGLALVQRAMNAMGGRATASVQGDVFSVAVTFSGSGRVCAEGQSATNEPR
jgi:two-component system sensor histidine kinase QseC